MLMGMEKYSFTHSGQENSVWKWHLSQKLREIREEGLPESRQELPTAVGRSETSLLRNSKRPVQLEWREEGSRRKGDGDQTRGNEGGQMM